MYQSVAAAKSRRPYLTPSAGEIAQRSGESIHVMVNERGSRSRIRLGQKEPAKKGERAARPRRVLAGGTPTPAAHKSTLSRATLSR